jgi:hypothetical protein
MKLEVSCYEINFGAGKVTSLKSRFNSVLDAYKKHFIKILHQVIYLMPLSSQKLVFTVQYISLFENMVYEMPFKGEN